MQRLTGRSGIYEIREHLTAFFDQDAQMPEKSPQSIDVFRHAYSVAQHENRVEAPAVELKHVRCACISDSLFTHDLNRLWRYVDGTDRESSSLENNRMVTGPGSDIQNMAPA